MKSYLSLIPISAKTHKRQNRMTIFCIVIAVFLVTAVFSMAEMGIGMQKNNAIKEHGNWHIMLKNVPKSQVEHIGSQPDVAYASWYDIINYSMESNYYIGGKKATICGTEEPLVNNILNCIKEGNYPKREKEVMLSYNAKDVLGVKIGDSITLNTPKTSMDFIISGFADEGMAKVHDSIIAVMDISAFNKFFDDEDINNSYFIQFNQHTNIRQIITDIKAQYGFSEDNLSENTALLGITGFSSKSFMMGIYMVAVVLFMLILIAGVLMIAGSINSNVTQRSQFFGMMRCIGASKKQIIRLVRLEALNWCKSAIPIGVVSGVAITWILCAVLKYGIGGEFSNMPMWQVSIIGIISGIIVGVLTVMLAAVVPAKHAAKVSPVTAVSGNAINMKSVHSSASMFFSKIYISLGVHHAVSSKKNLLLMTGSFALSIILFLSFSSVLDFAKRALNPLNPYAPDVSIMSSDRSCTVNKDLVTKICDRKEVKRVFGRMYQGNIGVTSNKNVNKIDLISYEDYQLNWAKKTLVSGDLSKILSNDNYVLTVYDKSNPLNTGDKLKLNNDEFEVAGVLSTSPFNADDIPTIICSEETFTRLTGKNNYAVIDIQFSGKETDEDVTAIRNLVYGTNNFSDRREINRETTNTYLAFTLLVYGFLAIIAMITIFNIINSISMSVSARIRQYGAMRAVGMDKKQIMGMIASEAFTYAISGCIVGCIFGLPLNQFIFKKMITDYWGETWRIPFVAIAIILLIVFMSAIVAIYTPTKRIKNMAITDTINEL